MKYLHVIIILVYLNIIGMYAQNLVKVDTSKCVFLGYILLIAQMLNDNIPPIKVENINIDGLKFAMKDTNLIRYHECLETCRSKWGVVIVEYGNEAFAKTAWEKEQLYGGKKENMAIFKWRKAN